jgi:hypothetical protein
MSLPRLTSLIKNYLLIRHWCRLSTTRFSWAPTQMRAQKNSRLYRLFGFRASPGIKNTFTHTPVNSVMLRYLQGFMIYSTILECNKLQSNLQVSVTGLQGELQSELQVVACL